MNARTLAELALKLWGVTLLLGALLSLPATLWMFGTTQDDDPQSALVRATQAGYILNVVLQAVAGFAVLVWADSIVALFESGSTPLQVGASAGELQVLGFALVGAFFLVNGLGEAAAAGYVLLTKPEFDPTDTWSYMWARQGEGMVKAVVQIAAGALLVFGREALVHGWSRFRGQTPADSGDDDTAG